jgi:hypothetical protein
MDLLVGFDLGQQRRVAHVGAEVGHRLTGLASGDAEKVVHLRAPLRVGVGGGGEKELDKDESDPSHG